MSPPICASYLTLAGSAHGQPPGYSALERARAAAAHGIHAIGVRIDEPLDLRILDHVTIPECEWLDLSRPVTPQQENSLGVLAADFGVQRVNTGLCASRTPWWEAEANLKTIVAAARRHGITVCVEPVAFGGIATLGQVLSLLAHAGFQDDPDTGICFDLWQVAQDQDKPRWSPQQLTRQITSVQACGVTLGTGSLFAASQDRPLIKDSAVDTRLWLTQLYQAGCRAPLSYEQPHAAWRELPLDQMAAAAAADMALLERANAGTILGWP